MERFSALGKLLCCVAQNRVSVLEKKRENDDQNLAYVPTCASRRTALPLQTEGWHLISHCVGTSMSAVNRKRKTPRKFSAL